VIEFIVALIAQFIEYNNPM